MENIIIQEEKAKDRLTFNPIPDTLNTVTTALYSKFKVGIYKELYKKGLLGEKQLDALIKLQNTEREV